VVIDSSPILAVADASVIGRIAGMTMLVARFDKTTTREIELANKRCEQNGVHVNGCIINGVVKKASNYYGYGSYGEYQYDTRKQDAD
jgi:tyrosine-protein kinase Etk/Wzc